jgi:hypothetical protein
MRKATSGQKKKSKKKVTPKKNVLKCFVDLQAFSNLLCSNISNLIPWEEKVEN